MVHFETYQKDTEVEHQHHWDSSEGDSLEDGAPGGAEAAAVVWEVGPVCGQ